MTKGQLEIHSENILPIIKKWLYSEKEIFVRELISNSCDAIQKLKLLQNEEVTDSFQIDVTIDKEKGTLTFSDNGIGMTDEEVTKYIAQIAFSGAEDFIQQYEKTSDKETFIGHFGLGFYSSYMVADTVEIETLSYKKEADPVRWVCDGGTEYTLEKGSRQERGTSIILHISEESKELLEEPHLKKILLTYCEYLPYPITFNGTRINEKEPLWVKPAHELKKEDYIEFYRHLYPMQEDPIFWVHLTVDYPFHLKGILYFPKMGPEYRKPESSIKLFCNRVFVSDNCKDILPEFLLPLKGILDSPDIPLNVSRSYLQVDRTVRQLSTHITKKVADALVQLKKTDKEFFFSHYKELSLILKIGSIENDKFYDRIKECLLMEKLDGGWMSAKEYLDEVGSKTDGKIYYCSAPPATAIRKAFEEKEIPILLLTHAIDTYLLGRIEAKEEGITFARVDSEVSSVLHDESREKTIVDESGQTEAGKMANSFGDLLENKEIQVEAKSLQSDSLPALITLDENERRVREYMRLNSGGSLDLPNRKTLVLNSNSPLVQAVLSIKEKDPALAKELAEEIVELTLMKQSELAFESLAPFAERTSQLLEKLLQFQQDPS